MMARKKNRFFRALVWVTGIILCLLVLLFVSFYLGRNWMKDRALSMLNQDRPGELVMGKMNLTPFMHFPSIAVQLKDIRYYQAKLAEQPMQDPFIDLDDLYLSFDLLELIRGDLVVNQLRLEDGTAHYEIFKDSVSNLEKALGRRLAEETGSDDTTSMDMRIDLRKIELINVQLSYLDSTRGSQADLDITELESKFSYRGDMIGAGIQLEMDIRSILFDSIRIEDRGNFRARGDILVDQEKRRVEIAPSSVGFQGLELSASGLYQYDEQPRVDLIFTARNTGLEVLNFMLLGILDLEDIEQVGKGSIALDGSIRGDIGPGLPEIEIRGSAREMSFKLKAYDRLVEDISFDLEASSGSLSGFRGAEVVMQNFSMRASEAWLKGDLRISNFSEPEFSIQMLGDLDLAGLEQVIRKEQISGMHGRIALESKLEGRIDASSDILFREGGSFQLNLKEVGFNAAGDSLSHMNGQVTLEDNLLESRGLELAYNGNLARLDFRMENLIHYLLGYERDVSASLYLESEHLRPGQILEDSSLVALMGEEIRGLNFGIEAEISKEELDAFINEDSIPHVDVSIDRFAVDLPNYANISNVEASLGLGPDSIVLHSFKGRIGESRLELSALMENYRSILDGKGDATCRLEYAIRSDLVQASDLFQFGDEFLLPETYQDEYLEDFRFQGSVNIPVAGLIHDSVETNFLLNLEYAAWNFKNYPLVFQDFKGQVGKRGPELYIEDFEGSIGASDFKLTGSLTNLLDSTRQTLNGYLFLESSLLDFNQLLNFETGGKEDSTLQQKEAPHLDQIEYPNFTFQADVRELRYGDYGLFGIRGRLRSSASKIFYLDSLITSAESGGSILLDGQFNVSSPNYYNFSANLDLKDVDVDDLNFELQSGEESQSLSETFRGRVSAKGLAEIFITPDLKLDMAMTTAMFAVRLKEGRLINFSPLEAVGKYLDNKDLNNVRFSNLDNTFTLVDSQILVPRMRIESTIGNMILEGEQGLDGSYLYLLRLPMWLLKEAARNRLTGGGDEDAEDEIRELKMGKFMLVTAWAEGEENRVRLGDKRDKFR